MTQPLPDGLHVGSQLIIEELVATTPGGQPRVLILAGPALPLKGGAKWGGDTRLITKWYPGNGTEATQQNLGPTETPSDMSGEWNRTRMGRAPSTYRDETGTQRSVIEPMDLYEILDSIRRDGARLRVTWATQGSRLVGTSSDGSVQSVDRKIVREGRIKTLEITPDTEVDLRWNMNFEWVGRGATQDKAASVRRDDDLVQATSAVQQSIAALDFFVATKMVSLRPDKRLSASTLTLGQFEKLAEAPKKLVDDATRKLRYNLNQFKRVAEVAKKLAYSPVSMANSAVDFARNTTAIANQYVTSFSRAPVEVLSFRSKVSDLARAAKHFGQVADQMTVAARRAAELEQKLRDARVSGGNRGQITVKESATTRAGDLIAIHVCKAGDTPTRLSSKYYQSPDHAADILRANRLPLHTPSFAPGKVVIIPALSSGKRER